MPIPTLFLSAMAPDQLVPSYEQDGLTIVRSNTNDNTIKPLQFHGKDAVATCLNSLIATIPTQKRHSKFKIIRVLPDVDAFTTRQLVAFSGRDTTRAVEQNSTWRIDWSWPDPQQPPTIKAITVEKMEQVTSLRSGQFFRDMTASVLSNENQIVAEQFGVGVDRWVQRLESYQLVFQFGHNGIAIGDLNGDGLDDVYRCQVGGLPNRLLIAQPDGTVVDQSRASGLDFLDNTRSALIVDLDNDGDQDIAVAFPFEILFLEKQRRAEFRSP